MNPTKTAFDHFWDWVGEFMLVEDVPVPLLGTPGFLQVEYKKYNVAFEVHLEFIENHEWTEGCESYFLSQSETRHLHAKYYRLKANAAQLDRHVHREIATYEADTGLASLYFLSAIAFYDTMISKSPEVEESLRSFKPYAPSTLARMLRGRQCAPN